MFEGLVLDYKKLVNVPKLDDIINKDECSYCYNDMEDIGGIYICLNSWSCFCIEHVEMACNEFCNERLFLNISKPHGNFRLELFYYKKDPYIMVREKFQGLLVDERVSTTINLILKRNSTYLQHSLLKTSENSLKVSRHCENLVQIPRVLKEQYKCEECEINTGLWLNLSDGRIFCGRKFFNGEGGNNHSLKHYEETTYPLVVRLGTICSSGAEVYSYDEDDFVIDSCLEGHLASFGIVISECVKTEKTIREIELEMNENLKFQNQDILDSKFQLTFSNTEKFCGIANNGNTCFISCIFQLLMGLDEFRNQFKEPLDKLILFRNGIVDDPIFQIYKLVWNCLSGKYANKVPPQDGNYLIKNKINPHHLIYSLFYSKKLKGDLTNFANQFRGDGQHDVVEFLLFLCELIESNKRELLLKEFSLKSHFIFKFHNKKSTPSDVQVYESDDLFLSIPIVFEDKKISFESSLRGFFNNQVSDNDTIKVDNYFATFPRYLLIHISRCLYQDGNVTKVDDELDIPESINLNEFASSIPDEQVIKRKREANVKKDDYIEKIISELLNMGFQKSISYHSIDIYKKKYDNQEPKIEYLVDWIFNNMDNPKYATYNNDDIEINKDLLAYLIEAGFPEDDSIISLKYSKNDFDKSLNILTNKEELNKIKPIINEEVRLDLEPQKDNIYDLQCFITHLGASPTCGHYVSYIKKDNEWFLINDSVVYNIGNVPIGSGYLYCYKLRM